MQMTFLFAVANYLGSIALGSRSSNDMLNV